MRLFLTLGFFVFGCRTDKVLLDTGHLGAVVTDPGDAASDDDRDGSPEDEDCDDGDPSVFPGAPETCDGLDNDCDGEVDEGLLTEVFEDADGDGYGDPGTAREICEIAEGQVTQAGDCDDSDAEIHPGVRDVCDGLDNDCDLEVDEDADGVTWYLDEDGDGYGDVETAITNCTGVAPEGYAALYGDCDETDATTHPGAAERCDEIDNDCNGVVDDGVTMLWYVDMDGDGAGSADMTFEGCDPTAGYVDNALDCDDTASAVNPWAYEACNGIDDDCDGTIDEYDALDAGAWYPDLDGDGYGDDSAVVTACEGPPGTVDVAGDCDDTAAAINPGASEVCNGIDDDCDGAVDGDDTDLTGTETYWQDADGDGYGSELSSVEACEAPSGFVLDDSDCDDSNAAVNPGAEEQCNGLDDDCDGLTDADDPSVADALTYYIDHDGDGFGSDAYTELACDPPAGFVLDETDCDDLDAEVNPAAEEVCNGVDDDCDGTTSWQEADTDGDGWLACQEALWLETSRSHHNDPAASGPYGSLEAAVMLSDHGIRSTSSVMYSVAVTPELLDTYGVLVIYGQGYDGPFSADESAALEAWVADGGRLLYMAGWGSASACATTNSLPSEFGITCSASGWTWSGLSTLTGTHPVEEGVSTISGLGGEIWTVYSPAFAIGTTGGWPSLVVADYGNGRVVGLSDEWPLYNTGTSGAYDISGYDNRQMVDNIWAWFAEFEL